MYFDKFYIKDQQCVLEILLNWNVLFGEIGCETLIEYVNILYFRSKVKNKQKQ